MHKFLALAMLVVLVSTASAQSTPPPADLLKTEAEREAAMFAGDEKTWTRYTTADFVFITRDGSYSTRAARGGEINGTPTTSPRVSEKLYHVHGDTVLVTTLREQSNGKYRGITVWVKENGIWKVASVQQTAVSNK